jgi:hypothetical protein
MGTVALNVSAVCIAAIRICHVTLSLPVAAFEFRLDGLR